jgi:3-hydroxyisobutyrate dehydrogenase-like beta-hydroxyacid dehydrogenase
MSGPKETIGLVGVGLLGSAMAQRLLESGFEVLGWDTELARRDGLIALGGRSASGLLEVAACRQIVLSLPNSEIASRVIDELLPSLSREACVIDTTTGDPQTSAALGARLAASQVEYFDATILGSSAEARRGEVVAMVGGRGEAMSPCHDLLAAFARQTFHVGPWGSGARMKLVVNLALGLHRAVLAEALTLAEASGLDGTQTLDVLRSGAAYSRVMDTKGEKMLFGDFTPQARLAQHRKDVRLMLEMGSQAGAALPLTELHDRLLGEAIRLDCGELDNSAIIQWYRAERKNT